MRLDSFRVVLGSLGHQVEAERQYELNITDICFLLRCQFLLLLLHFSLLFILGFSEVAQVVEVILQQGIWHFALIEECVQFPQIRVVEFLVSRKVLPKGHLLSCHKILVLLLLFQLLR